MKFVLMNKQVIINVVRGVGLVMGLTATVIDQTTRTNAMRQEIAKEVQKQVAAMSNKV